MVQLYLLQGFKKYFYSAYKVKADKQASKQTNKQTKQL